MKVLAIDPGEKCGWAHVEMDNEGHWLTKPTTGITRLKPLAMKLVTSYKNYDVVLLETWRLAAGHEKDFIGSQFPTVQFIGMVRLIAWNTPQTKLVLQTPSNKKQGLPSMKVCMPELYAKVMEPIAHDEGHDDDALMHLWYYTFKHLLKELPHD